MVQSFHLKGGYNLPVKGEAPTTWLSNRSVDVVAVSAEDYEEVRWRPVCKEGDAVKVGTPVLEDKRGTGIVQVSSVSGTVQSVVRGEKRKLLRIEIKSDNQFDTQKGGENSDNYSISSDAPNQEKVIEQLLQAGLWPFIKKRPYGVMANPEEKPAQIFVNAMMTAPLSPQVSFCLKEKEEWIQKGCDILNELSVGKVYLSFGPQDRSFFESVKNVELACFEGAHPAGNTSTHIYHLNPRQSDEVYWTIDIFDVVRIGEQFSTGDWQKTTWSVLTGNIKEKGYIELPLGASFKSCLGDAFETEGNLFIDKDVLSGHKKDIEEAYLSFCSHQIHVLPFVRDRYFLRFLRPGWSEFSLSRMFVGNGSPKEYDFDSDRRGSLRNIVLNDIYDSYSMLDIPVYFLIKAVLAEEWDEAIRIGLLDTVPEDFSLCTFACPSKVNVGEVVRKGLDELRKEEE